jgi:hypothetical protein
MIHIRSGIKVKILTLDPYQNYPNPQHWCLPKIFVLKRRRVAGHEAVNLAACSIVQLDSVSGKSSLATLT